jgi:LexA DNA binding domain.
MSQLDALEERLMSESNNDGGGRDRSTDDMELIEAICNADGPVASTSEIAEAVGMTRQGAGNRLQQLADKGIVECKGAGSGLMWWPDFYPVESESDD